MEAPSETNLARVEEAWDALVGVIEWTYDDSEQLVADGYRLRQVGDTPQIAFTTSPRQPLTPTLAMLLGLELIGRGIEMAKKGGA